MSLARISPATTIFFILILQAAAARQSPSIGGDANAVKAGNKQTTTTTNANPTPPSIRVMRGKQRNKRNSIAREFLGAHNSVRIRNGEQPLIWDRNLARYARRWAQQRIVDCNLMHSPNPPFGENLFWAQRENWTAAAVVEKWVEEYKNYRVRQNTCVQGQMCGHYTQIVWKSTVRLGCGQVKCNGGGLFVICAYDPPGNIENVGPFDDFPTYVQPPSRPPPSRPTTTQPTMAKDH